jgi:hypothetical protein
VEFCGACNNSDRREPLWKDQKQIALEPLQPVSAPFICLSQSRQLDIVLPKFRKTEWDEIVRTLFAGPIAEIQEISEGKPMKLINVRFMKEGVTEEHELHLLFRSTPGTRSQDQRSFRARDVTRPCFCPGIRGTSGCLEGWFRPEPRSRASATLKPIHLLMDYGTSI